MDKNESKLSSIMSQKQAQYSFEAINNLRQISLCHENPSHDNNNNIKISDHIFPFCIANTSTSPRLFSNPNPNPNEDSATDDSSRDQMSQRHHDSDQRRLKRMISNRESARRSRMRRKMQIEELQYLVAQLQTTNRQLSEKLIQLLDCNQQMVQDNSQLKDKVSSLQMILADFLVPLGNVSGAEDHHDYGPNKGDDRVNRAQEFLLNHR